MSEDIITRAQRMERRIRDIEKGDTLTRPHPKWIPSGGGGNVVNLHQAAISGVGVNVGQVYAFYSDPYPLTLEGSAIANVRSVSLMIQCVPLTEETPGSPGSPNTYLSVQESDGSSDNWQIDLRIYGADAKTFEGVINLTSTDGCVLTVDYQTDPRAFILNALANADTFAEYILTIPKEHWPSPDQSACRITVGSYKVVQ